MNSNIWIWSPDWGFFYFRGGHMQDFLRELIVAVAAGLIVELIKRFL